MLSENFCRHQRGIQKYSLRTTGGRALARMPLHQAPLLLAPLQSSVRYLPWVHFVKIASPTTQLPPAVRFSFIHYTTTPNQVFQYQVQSLQYETQTSQAQCPWMRVGWSEPSDRLSPSFIFFHETAFSKRHVITYSWPHTLVNHTLFRSPPVSIMASQVISTHNTHTRKCTHRGYISQAERATWYGVMML